MQKETWSSGALPRSRQFAGFQSALCRAHAQWDLKADAASGYFAEVKRNQVDDFQLTRVYCDPVKGERSKDVIKRSDGFFCVLFLDYGRTYLRQGSNEAVVASQQVALWDSTRPAMFESSEPVCQVSLLLPHHIGTAMVSGIEDMCGTSINASAGLGQMLYSHLRQLNDNIDHVPEHDRPAVLRATVELIGAAFRPDLDLQGSGFRRALIRRVQDYILANLHDPELSPARIAGEFRFSVRYLHRLFEETDHTAGGWIRKRRLLAAQAALRSSSNAGISVTEIAMRCGFADQSHFSHAFKQEFGVSPRDYRLSA